MSELTLNSFGDNTNGNLPPEMLTMVLSWVDSAGNKSIPNLRLVCKYWRDVIDNNINFQPTINDDKRDVASMSHLRVHQCVVQKLLSPLFHGQIIFRDPALLKKLRLDGQIKRENFMIMVAQFTNLEELNLKRIHMNVPNLLIPATPEEENNLNRFLGQLKHLELQLEVCCPNMVRYISDDIPACKNFRQLMQTDMHNLETLQIKFGCFNLEVEDSCLLPFLLDHAPNLKNLRIESRKGLPKRPREIVEMEQNKQENRNNNEQFRPLHLHSLKLDISNTFWKTNWMPIIELQRSLENLEIKITSETGTGVRSEDYPKFNDLEDTLAQNVVTLNSLTLRDIGLSEKMNFCLLRKLEKMERMKIITVPNSAGKTFNFIMEPPSNEIQTREYNTRHGHGLYEIDELIAIGRPIVVHCFRIRCGNCGTDQTPIWPHNINGEVLCNACGLSQ